MRKVYFKQESDGSMDSSFPGFLQHRDVSWKRIRITVVRITTRDVHKSRDSDLRKKSRDSVINSGTWTLPRINVSVETLQRYFWIYDLFSFTNCGKPLAMIPSTIFYFLLLLSEYQISSFDLGLPLSFIILFSLCSSTWIISTE